MWQKFAGDRVLCRAMSSYGSQFSVSPNMEATRQRPKARLQPSPRALLREQMREVMRFLHYSHPPGCRGHPPVPRTSRTTSVAGYRRDVDEVKRREARASRKQWAHDREDVGLCSDGNAASATKPFTVIRQCEEVGGPPGWKQNLPTQIQIPK